MSSESKPTVNLAAVYEEPPTTKTKIVELPIPEPELGQVLVRLQFSGVCHTDYAFCTGSFPGLPPAAAGQVGGHEGIGEVIAQGPGVQSPAIGAKVGIKFAADACTICNECLRGSETSCSKSQISGYTCPGTFQQYVVSPAHYVTPIPDGMDLAAAAPLMCGGVSVYAAINRIETRNGDWLVISGGGGGLGHLAIQYGKALGCRVLAIDSGKKKELCLELGSDEFLDFQEYDADEALAAKVLEITGGGARAVVMCSSSMKAYNQAPFWLRTRGTLLCLGVPHEGAISANLTLMVDKEMTITALKSGNRLETIECLEIAARCGIKTKYRLCKLDELTQVFEDMEEGKILGRVVVDLR